MSQPALESRRYPAVRPVRRQLSPRLAYEVVGSGPPLVLLHGLSASGRWWSRNIPEFSRHYRTYAIDLPGFGASRRVRWSRLDDTVAWLAAWLADEALPAVHIAGHSLGAAVAARMAARHPDRVQQLVLVSAAIRPRGVRARMLSSGVVRLVTQRPSQSYVPLFARDLLRSHPVSSIAASLDALQRDWESDLARIVAPTLVVWGERDPITPISLAHGIAATIPDARLLTLPDTGHSPMWEEPDVFNEAVLDFLERSPVRAG